MISLFFELAEVISLASIKMSTILLLEIKFFGLSGPFSLLHDKAIKTIPTHIISRLKIIY
jgi:hypothetical protein